MAKDTTRLGRALAQRAAGTRSTGLVLDSGRSLAAVVSRIGAVAVAGERSDRAATPVTVRRRRSSRDGQVTLSVTVADDGEADALAAVVPLALNAVRSERDAERAIMNALLPPGGLRVPEATLAQVRRNAQARVELANEFGLLAAADVATQAGSSAANASALASRWRKEGRVFAVEDGRAKLFPGFQFDEAGQPRPMVADILSALSGSLDGWEFALWFTGENGWLEGVRPVDVLDSDAAVDRDRVLGAAASLAAEIAG